MYFPPLEYDSTFNFRAPSRAAIEQGQGEWVPASAGGGTNYFESYVALVSYNGSINQTEFQDMDSANVEFDREDEGLYSFSAEGFGLHNTWVSVTPQNEAQDYHVIEIDNGGLMEIWVYCFDGATGAAEETQGFYIEIRKY